MQDFLDDEEKMLSIACAALIRSGKVDPLQGRQFVVELQTDGQEPADLTEAQLTQLRQDCTELRDGWSQDQRKEAVFKQAGYVICTMMTGSRAGKAVARSIAFAGTFSFLDLLLIPMSLMMAFKTGAGRN